MSTEKEILKEKPAFGWVPGDFVKGNQDLLKECATLYSNHYGIWSKSSTRPGQRIQLSPDRISKWLDFPGSALFYAKVNNRVIGYAIATIEKVQRRGKIAWVTQLVVHQDYRHRGIGKRLLFSVWNFSDYFAWGVLTSSPYAVRALEKATRRRCSPYRIYKNKKMLFNFGLRNVSYVKEDMELEVNNDVSRINTKFLVDHSKLKQMIDDVTSTVPWTLGSLEEGWEWFAFTFIDQVQLELSSEEIEEMLKASDEVTRQAYSRMQIDKYGHLWSRHTDDEVQFIVNNCNLSNASTVLDLGCGKGRHAIALAKRGFGIVGIDYSDILIEKAETVASLTNLTNIEFRQEDCRFAHVENSFDAVICLYDVIGSYVDDSDNIQIIQNIYNHLKPKGMALISVMNYDLTKALAINFFSLSKEANKLLKLQASRTMETTGNIFNPNYYMIDTDNEIIYRKEQFHVGESMPEELLVRDKRYSMEKIIDICEGVGLEVLWARYVGAGKWEVPLQPTDKKAKEILLLCRKQ